MNVRICSSLLICQLQCGKHHRKRNLDAIVYIRLHNVGEDDVGQLKKLKAVANCTWATICTKFEIKNKNKGGQQIGIGVQKVIHLIPVGLPQKGY